MGRLLVVALLVVPFLGCGGQPVPEPVLLGMLQPLHGPARDRGEEARRGAQLAVKELRADEVTVEGRPFTVLHADSGETRETLRAEAVRLLAVNRVVALLGALPPEQGEALLREARLLSAAAVLAGEVPTPPTAAGLLTLGVGPAGRAKALVRFLRDNLRPTRVGLLIDENAALAVNFAEILGRGLHATPALTFDEARYRNADEQASSIKHLLDRKPEAILLALPVQEQPAVLKRLRDAGFTGSTLAGGADTEPSPVLGTSTAPHYRVTVYAGSGLSAAGQRFVKSYREQFGAEPGVTAVLSWEAVRLLAETMSKAGSVRPLRLRELLSNDLEFEGITGPIGFTDRQAVRPLFVVKQTGAESKVERVFSPGE